MEARHALPLVSLLLAAPAAAGSRVGIGASASADLPDAASADHTRFGVAGGLVVPVAVELGPRASLRLAARADVARGRDRLVWTAEDGRRVHDDDHFALLAGVGAALGVEVALSEQALVPYVTASAGPSWIANYHSLGGVTAPLLDPSQNDLKDPGNIDPSTSQVVLAYEAGVGLRREGVVAPWVELAWANAYVPEAMLRRTPRSADAVRAAWGWNVVRAAAGVAFKL